jgi:molybdopterin-guanine dinucleotide biosynthesis protein A
VDPYAAVILAGGAARRFGGVDKPMLTVRGRPMLHRVLDAVPDAADRIVVGPPTLDVPDGVRRVREEPPGGGPVAATAAGLAGVTAPTVALLAADLPFLDRTAIRTLRTALTVPVSGGAALDGVVFLDGDGKRQTLCGVWRTGSLRDALARIGPLASTLPETATGGARPAGVPLRALLAGLRVGEVAAGTGGPPPWYDCDEPDDLHRAEEWI